MKFDKSKFIEGFKLETKDYIDSLNNSFLALEKNPDDNDILESILREIHSVKGSSAMMGYIKISRLAHSLEEGIKYISDHKLELKKKHFDIFFEFLDVIGFLLEDEKYCLAKGIDDDFLDNLCMRASKLDIDGVDQSVKKDLKSDVKKEVGESSIRIVAQKLDLLMNLSSVLKISDMQIKALLKRITESMEVEDSAYLEVEELNQLNEKLSSSISDIHNEIMQLRMVPIEGLFNVFPRAIRDLIEGSDKEIDFKMQGHSTLLDKSILEAIKDPILHLLRNSVDHGIETKEERRKCCKPAVGSISLTACQKGSYIVLEISDDGRGLDSERIKKRAVKDGLCSLSAANSMSEKQVHELLFTLGFSTNDNVTTTSGRGVGLNAVKDQVKKLQGLVSVRSKKDLGTSIIITLPLTLALTYSLLVEVGDQIFGIPFDNIIETKVLKSSIHNSNLPVVDIQEIFNCEKKKKIAKPDAFIVIVQANGEKFGLLVDDIVDYQEVVCKPLGRPLNNVRNISGGIILGDGKLALMLDVLAIANNFAPQRECIKKTILLVEDNPSSARMEKNILEAAGFSVDVARNGEHGLELAMEKQYDLVISDIVMPKMDGFEFICNLKKISSYSSVPVVIVTTKDSEEDREKGLQVGADAYILKKNFNMDAVCDTIKELLIRV